MEARRKEGAGESARRKEKGEATPRICLSPSHPSLGYSLTLGTHRCHKCLLTEQGNLPQALGIMGGSVPQEEILMGICLGSQSVSIEPPSLPTWDPPTSIPEKNKFANQAPRSTPSGPETAHLVFQLLLVIHPGSASVAKDRAWDRG